MSFIPDDFRNDGEDEEQEVNTFEISQEDLAEIFSKINKDKEPKGNFVSIFSPRKESTTLELNNKVEISPLRDAVMLDAFLFTSLSPETYEFLLQIFQMRIENAQNNKNKSKKRKPRLRKLQEPSEE